MLDCRANFSNGYGGKMCDLCCIHDDEKHRMNECVKFRSVNRCDDQLKISFDDIYYEDMERVKPVIDSILTMWDLKNGKNKMCGD